MVVMAFRPCPNCAAHTARLLEASTQEAVAWCVHCHECGHVWTVSRDEKEIVPDATVQVLDAVVLTATDAAEVAESM